MKKVYILLSRTGSIPSRVIHFFTRGKYTHSSISLEPKNDTFFSYGRRKLHNILVGGLINENLNEGVFALFPDSVCELFSIDVDEQSYRKIQQMIKFYLDNYDKCTYKFSAVLPMYFGVKQKLKFKMTCSQFVATLLKESGTCTLPKHPSLMHPNDFRKITEMKRLYIGKIRDFRFSKQETIA